MNLEFLVSTLNCKNIMSLYKQMNIKSDALIINQFNDTKFSEQVVNLKNVRSYMFNEIGVGLSRNNALFRSRGDICILADDDMIYNDNASEVIKRAYEKYEDADFILFDVTVIQNGKERHTVTENKRVRSINCLKYGAVSFTFKRERILQENISFSLLFGGGARYGSGEDSIFIWNSIKKGLKVYAVNENIATVYNDDSTWFDGYNEKFFSDKGALFYSLSRKASKLLCIQFLLRHRKMFKDNFPLKKAYSLMLKGINDMKGDKNNV